MIGIKKLRKVLDSGKYFFGCTYRSFVLQTITEAGLDRKSLRSQNKIVKLLVLAEDDITRSKIRTEYHHGIQNNSEQYIYKLTDEEFHELYFDLNYELFGIGSIPREQQVHFVRIEKNQSVQELDLFITNLEMNFEMELKSLISNDSKVMKKYFYRRRFLLNN